MNRGTGQRLLTGAALIPVFVATVWLAPNWVVAIVAAGIAVVALSEFFAMGERMGFRAYHVWTYLTAVGMMAVQWWAAQGASPARLGELLYRARAPQPELGLVLVGFLFGAAVVAVCSRRPLAEAFPSVSVSAAGLVLVVLPFSAVVRLHGVDGVGPKLLLFTLTLVWAGDTAAYFAGRGFGKFKMAPQLSPGKTWEGAVANLLAALLVAALFGYWMRLSPAHMLAMGVAGSVAGQLGDLFESALKRSAGVKDSGTLLPGHGGMLDRIDALIFAAPAVWYYFEWIVTRRLY